jgi:hypothetical protein
MAHAIPLEIESSFVSNLINGIILQFLVLDFNRANTNWF